MYYVYLLLAAKLYTVASKRRVPFACCSTMTKLIGWELLLLLYYFIVFFVDTLEMKGSNLFFVHTQLELDHLSLDLTWPSDLIWPEQVAECS